MVVRQPSKLVIRVRFPSPAPVLILSLFGMDRAAERFFPAPYFFAGKHLLFGAPGSPALLAPDFFNPLAFGAHPSEAFGFEFIKKDTPRQEPIQPLRPFPGAFYLNAGRPVF